MTRHLLVTGAGYAVELPGHTLERPDGLTHAVVSLCTSGRGQLRMAGAVHAVEPSTASFLPPRMPHAQITGDEPWMHWWVFLAGSQVPELVGALGASAQAPIIRVPNIDRAAGFVDEIISGFERHPSLGQLVEASGLAWRLLTFLAVDRRRPEPSDPVQRAMDYIADHLDARIEIPTLAKRVGMSTSRLLAGFQTATGGGAIAYQSSLRMAKAAQLLDNSGASISEIARAVGYDDPYYFSRRFHSAHGMSPTQFRRREWV